jgi:hypothetical protein
MPDSSSRKALWPALALFLLLFCIYNANFRHGSSTDTISTTALPVSIITEGDFDLDEFRGLLSTHTQALDAALKYFGGMQERDGHLVSSYPLGAAVMAVPFFAAAHYSGYLQQWHHYRVVGKIAASAMVAFAAVFIFLALRLQIDQRAAWMLALFFALGTSAWSISSQDLWQQGPGSLCLAAAIYALSRLEREPSQTLAVLAGICLGLAVYCRLLNAVPTAALSLFMLLHQRRYLIAYLAPLAAFACVIAYYNLTTFGNLSGGYDAIYKSPAHAWRGIDSASGYSNPLLKGLVDTLVSPSRGLWIYSPFTLAGFAAIIPLLRTPGQPVLPRYLALWVAMMCVILAKNTIWWGGATFGPRYFAEVCIALAVLAGVSWQWLRDSRLARAAITAGGIVAIAIHGIGALFAPCGWEVEPTLTDVDPSRFWNWRDMEIERCAKSGFVNGFKSPEILLYKAGDTDL